mgnify:CR=1 FL=1
METFDVRIFACVLVLVTLAVGGAFHVSFRVVQMHDMYDRKVNFSHLTHEILVYAKTRNVDKKTAKRAVLRKYLLLWMTPYALTMFSLVAWLVFNGFKFTPLIGITFFVSCFGVLVCASLFVRTTVSMILHYRTSATPLRRVTALQKPEGYIRWVQ